MKKTVLNILLCVSIFFASCAGREANPIALSTPVDDTLSCDALEAGLTNLQSDMKNLKQKTNKFWTNTFWFIVFPFLIDVKDAEKIEYNAFQRRYNHLLIIAQEKNCDFAALLRPIMSAE